MTKKQMQIQDRVTLYLRCPDCGREVQRTVSTRFLNNVRNPTYLPRGSWQCPNGCKGLSGLASLFS
jgi:uncharacterized protein with PIN domain